MFRSKHTVTTPVLMALLLIGGLLLLAPGICAVLLRAGLVGPATLSEKAYFPAVSRWEVPSDTMQQWIISFILSAVGIALIICAFRRPAPTIPMVVIGITVLLSGLFALVFFMAQVFMAQVPLHWLWTVCLVISAGGMLLLYEAFRKSAPPPPEP